MARAANGAPLRLARTIEDRLQAIDRDTAAYGARLVADALIGARRPVSILLGIFAGLALALTALGIGSVVAYGAAQRRQEIGIRMALGADPRAVVRLVMRGMLLPVAAGIAIGSAAIVPLTAAVRSLLFGVTPADPLAIAAACAALAAAAAASAYFPARRASRVDPLEALRS